MTACNVPDSCRCMRCTMLLEPGEAAVCRDCDDTGPDAIADPLARADATPETFEGCTA